MADLVVGGIGIATGKTLDKVGELLGVKRKVFMVSQNQPSHWEDDASYRDRLIERTSWKRVGDHVDITIGSEHDGHVVVENHALGKAFKYCRNCKTEVL